MSEVYLLFYQAALQIFVHINKLLQREDPIISIMRGQLNSFLKKLFGRFVTITAIQAADMDISSLDYNNPSNQLPGNIGNLYLYLTTTSSTACFRHRFVHWNHDKTVHKEAWGRRRCHSSPSERIPHGCARILLHCCNYALANLPLKDEVLQNAEFVNFGDRASATITQVTYFLMRWFNLCWVSTASNNLYFI